MRRLLVLAGLAGCTAKLEAPTIEAVSVADGKPFAAAFERALEACAPELETLVDKPTMLRIGLTGADLSEAQFASAVPGFTGEFHVQSLCTNKTAFKLLAVRTVGGQAQALFRGLLPGHGVNYVELQLGRVAPSREVKAVDIYGYVLGEKLSATYGSYADQLVHADDAQIADMRHQIAAFRAALKASDYAAAKAAFAALPAGLRATKAFRIQAIQIEMLRPDDAAYVAILEHYRTDFPGDPSLDLLMFDHDLLLHHARDARAGLDRLAQRVGGDAYLDVLRSEVSFDEGDAARAIKEATAATVAEPELEAGWLALIDAHVLAKDYAAAVATDQELGRRFHHRRTESELAKDPKLAPFLDSVEYKAWQHPAAAPTP